MLSSGWLYICGVKRWHRSFTTSSTIQHVKDHTNAAACSGSSSALAACNTGCSASAQTNHRMQYNSSLHMLTMSCHCYVPHYCAVSPAAGLRPVRCVFQGRHISCTRRHCCSTPSGITASMTAEQLLLTMQAALTHQTCRCALIIVCKTAVVVLAAPAA